MISYLLVYPVPVIGTGFPVIRLQHWPAVSACFISSKTDAARLIVNSPSGRMGKVPWTKYRSTRMVVSLNPAVVKFCSTFFLTFLFAIKKNNRLRFSCISDLHFVALAPYSV